MEILIEVKFLKIIHSFAKSDEADWDTELITDGKDDSSFGGAIHLGDDDAADIADFFKGASL